MSGELGDAEVSTGGTRTLTPGPLGAASIEERLAALRETVRTWDWRTAVLDAPPAPVEDTTHVHSTAETTAPVEFAEESVLSSGLSQAEVRQEPVPASAAAAQALVHEEPAFSSAAMIAPIEVHQDPMITDGNPVLPSEVVIPQAHVPPTSTETLSVPFVVSPPLTNETQAVPVITQAQAAPEQSGGGSGDFFDTPGGTSPEPKHGANGAFVRLWAHPWTKLAALCLVVVVAVLVVIWGLRLVHKDPGSGSGPTAATVTLPTTNHAATTTTTQAAVVIPVTAAQLAQYKQYASAFETANASAESGLASAGSVPTLAKVSPIVSSYLTALKLYNLQFHYVQWPTSMETDVATDDAQLSAMINFVQSASSVSVTGTWLSQLHAQAATLQTADNKIRQDLGLSASSSIP